MAIEKSYLTTFGVIVDKAYYKVQTITPWDRENSALTYRVNVWVWTNDYQREKNPDTPLATNIYFNFDCDQNLSRDEDTLTKQAYENLKVLTDSFKNDGTDV